jgi:DNA polymerase III delta prime subunit
MMNQSLKKKKIFLFLLSIQNKSILEMNKNNVLNTKEKEKKNFINNIAKKDTTLEVFENQNIDINFFRKINTNTKNIILKKCNISLPINTLINNMSYNYYFIDCNLQYDPITLSGSPFVEINTQNNHILFFHNIERILDTIGFIEKHISIFDSEMQNIRIVHFERCFLEINYMEQIINFLNNLHKKNTLSCLYLDNNKYDNEAIIVSHYISQFVNKNNITLKKINKKKIKTSSVNEAESILDIFQALANNIQAQEEFLQEEEKKDQNDKNISPKNKQELSERLNKKNQILTSETIKMLENDFNKIQSLEQEKKRTQILGKTKEDELSYMKTRLTIALQIPDNGIIRKDLPWDAFVILLRKIVAYKMDYGAESFVNQLIIIFHSAYQTGILETSNLCLYGPPGVGKTTMVEIAAFFACLFASSNKDLSCEILKKAVQNDEESFNIIIDYLESNYNEHICIFTLNGLTDQQALLGLKPFYSGATIGNILKGILNKKNPVIFHFDELDKLPNRSEKNTNPIAELLLNFTNNSIWSDEWFQTTVSFINVIKIATANKLEKINETLLDRWKKLLIAPLSAQAKKEVTIKILLDLFVKKQIIKNKKDFQIIVQKRKDVNMSVYQIGNNIFIDDEVINLIITNNNVDGLRSLKFCLEELTNQIFMENHNLSTTKNIHVTLNNIYDYIKLDNFSSQLSYDSNKSIKMLLTDKNNNHILSSPIISTTLGHYNSAVQILGESSQERYYIIQDLSKRVETILRNIVNLCPNSKSIYNLQAVTLFFKNQGILLVDIEPEISDDLAIIVSLVVASLPAILKIEIKQNIVIIGSLLANGIFTVGKINIQQKLTASTRFPEIKCIYLPMELKNNMAFQNYLQKNTIQLKSNIVYVSNLDELLKEVMVNENY